MRTLVTQASSPWTLTLVTVHHLPRSHTCCCSSIMTGYSKKSKVWKRAGVITRSVSPWASPVIMVSKKSAPGELPRRRMCINFHTVNALQPKVVKADSKAKGTLTLHLLPNIDQLYAQLRGVKIFTALNLRSGYYHIKLGKDS